MWWVVERDGPLLPFVKQSVGLSRCFDVFERRFFCQWCVQYGTTNKKQESAGDGWIFSLRKWVRFTLTSSITVPECFHNYPVNLNLTFYLPFFCILCL